MATVNARELHNRTSHVLNEVSKGKIFFIERHGKVIGTIHPSKQADNDWPEIMGEVWKAQKKANGRTRNPVLAERERRRR